MSARRWPVALGLVTALVGAGCESTLDHAKRVRAARKQALAPPPPLDVRQNSLLQVKVEAVLDDGNAAAVVVSMTNHDRRRAAVWFPISVRLTNAKGKVVETNTEGGNDETLTHVPSLAPGETAFFVDDQFTPGNGATAATVVLGGQMTALKAPLPRLQVSGVVVTRDPAGTGFTGTVRNTSTVAQPIVIVQAVARKGPRVVAAGTAVVRNLAPGASAPFKGFLTGQAGSAAVAVFAPPTRAG